ncbi:hypothetical protein [Streptomyces sp. NBC_01190]|uniref:hypothetical protein n=1 Tax=Streptomyces sp. NBC_01190 TaxID=2903767 RepID=UPI003870B840|nr:hypothetical protein OG519_26365 [Streptomyces sp. NBC_01190]
MSFMNTLKDKLGMSKDKADGLASEHGDRMESGAEKARDRIDDHRGEDGRNDDGRNQGNDPA